jgi:hypothetical protein
MHRGHGLQAGGVHDQQLPLVEAAVVSEPHQDAVVLGAGAEIGHERHLADDEPGVERSRLAAARLVVVLVHPVVGGMVGNQLVAMGDSPEQLFGSLSASGWL